MKPPPPARSKVSRYGVAVLLSLIVVALRGLLQPVLGDVLKLQLLTFAMLFSAWWGGLGAGLLATALCALAAHLFFLPAHGFFEWPAHPDGLRLVIFVCLGVAISAIAEALHRSARSEQAQKEALRGSEERLRLAVAATEDAVWDWNIADQPGGWSPAVADRFGWPEAPPDSDIGWWRERVHPDDRARVVESIDAAIADPACHHWQAEYRFQRGDGTMAHVLDRGSVLRAAGGEAVRMIGAMLDLTSRKQAEAAVREAAEQRRLALEAADLGAWDYRFHTGEVLGDERFFRMFGVIAERLAYEEAIERIHADDRAVTHEAVQAALAGADDGKFRREMRVIWPDGSLRWIAAHGRVYFTGSEGARQPLHFTGVCMDITERKRAMEELRLTTERFEAALRASPVILFEQDQELRYQWIHNSKIGLTTSTIEGKTDFELMERREDAEANVALRRQVIETGVRQRVEIRAQAGGRLRDYDISIEPRFDEAGQIVGVISAAVEITQHKAAENALRESREALSLALTGARMGTWDRDFTTEVLIWSDRTCELFGLPLEIVPRQADFIACLHPDDRLRHSAAVQLAVEQEPHSYECEYRVMLPDGACRWIFSKGAVHLDGAGRPAHMVGVSLDVTDRVLASERLAAAFDAAEAANRAKDAFLAALSHELRTPLTPVLFLAATLERSPEVTPALRQDFAMIRRNIELEARLIDDLLDVTRITRGKLQLDLQPTDLHAVLQRSLDLLRSDIEARQLALEIDLSATPAGANADPVRVQQVFWNVLKNAVKFTPEGGSIRVHSHGVEPGYWHLAVTDTGLGITVEELPSIFGAFAQGDEASSHRFGGLGLGLAICERVVREHGGRIWAESPGRNQGATFHIELPLDATPSAPQAAAPALPAAAAPRSQQLLIVEDHTPTRETLERLLKKRGYQTSIAATAAHARQLAAASTFNLMISDLGLPDGSGHELAAEFAQRYGLKAIALTGYGTEEDVRRSKAAGFLDHITKPVDIEALHDAIVRALDPE